MTRTTEPNGRALVLADRYRLEAQVAAGGMGEVWRATDLLLERTVAVKLLRESLAEDPIVSERFRREALTAARLSHPNMAEVYDYVQEAGRPGIVMEYVEGETLAERIGRDGAQDAGEAVRIASALLAALQAAHDAGIVHRDVKPGNVILGPNGAVKVTDFGIARAAGHETLTETGMVVGTAHYLSPEQVSGKPATPSSDVYATGAILYEMLTGTRPFEAETPLAVAMRRLTEDPIHPCAHRPDVPEAVTEVALRALAREPANRYRSAEEMRARLEAGFSAGRPATVPRRMDPTPTEVLPAVGDADATTVAGRAVPGPVTTPGVETPATGSAPATAVSQRRRRDYRRAGIWALVVAVVIVGTAWAVLAMRGSGPVLVPDFTGMQIAAAKALADELGVVPVEEPRDSARPKGQVLSQDIAADRRIARGERVTLFVSTGVPPCCEVPSLLELSRSEAEQELSDAGLTLGDVSFFSTDEYPPDTVIGQDPDPGGTEPAGSKVDILVATEPEDEDKDEDEDKGRRNGRGQRDEG